MISSYAPFSIRLADFGLAKEIIEPIAKSAADPPIETPDDADNDADDDAPADISDGAHNDTPHSHDGTHDWAAPEQLHGDGNYSNKVDLWSVGCVVYYLLTSLAPFSDHDAHQCLDVIARFKHPHWPRVYRARFLDLSERSPGHFIIVRGVGRDANQFPKALIVPNSSLRLSAKDALEHRWINPTGVEMMKVALRSGNQPLVHLLNKSGTSCVSDLEMLRLAAPGGHLEFVQRVLARPRKVKVIDSEGVEKAALIGAAVGGHDLVVAALLKSVKYPDKRWEADVYRLPCRRALEGGHTDVVDRLWPLVLKNASSTDLEYDFADHADQLMVAVAVHGTYPMLRPMISRLSYRARPDLAARIRTVMIQAAAHHGNIGSLDSLISPRFNRLDHDSALLEAAASGQLLVVEYLLKRENVAPMMLYHPGQAVPLGDVLSHALAKAANHGHLHILKYLFQRGIAPTQVAITAAASCDHTACFQFLVRVLRETYKTSSHNLFAYIGNSGIPHCTLELLKSHPHPENLQSHIKHAAELGRVDVVMWLLGRGGSVVDALGSAAEGG